MNRLCTAALCLSLLACGDKDGDSGAVAVDASFEGIKADVLVPSCGFSSCHGAGAGGLTLDEDTTVDDLVGVDSVGQPGSTLVVAGDSAGSYLIQKMRDDAGIDGTVMPQGGMLDDAIIARVELWIDDGANP